MFCFGNCFKEFIILFPVPGVEPVVAYHLELFIRDVLNKQFDEVHGRNSFTDKSIVFVSVVVKGNICTIIGINTGKSNHRSAEIPADVFGDCFGVTKVWFGIDIEAVFVFFVNGSFNFFEGRTDFRFHFIQECCLKGLAEITIIKVLDGTPEGIIRKTSFGKKAVNMWIPFQRTTKGMKNADKPRNEVFRFIHFKEHTRNNTLYSREKTMQERTVFKEEMP